MDVVGYDNIEDIQLQLSNPTGDDSSNSSVPGISSPKIDANTSVKNIPEPEPTTPDLVGWTTDIVWSASDHDTVARTSGNIKLADGTSYAVDTGNTGDISGITYIYYDGTTTLKTTTTPQDAVGANKIVLCVAKSSTSPTKAQFQAFGTIGLGVLITADNIAANTITANQIAANTITATQLSTSLLYAGAITLDTSGNIKSGQTSYETGTGFFLGNVGGTPKFSIGSSSKYLKWDGTAIDIAGKFYNVSSDTYTSTTIDGGFITCLGAQDKLTTTYSPRGINIYQTYYEKTLFRFTSSSGANGVERIGMEFSHRSAGDISGEIYTATNDFVVAAGDSGYLYLGGNGIRPVSANTPLGSNTYYWGIVSLRRLNFFDATTTTSSKTLQGYLECSIGGTTRYIAYYS